MQEKNKYEAIAEIYFQEKGYKFSKIPEFLNCNKPDYFLQIKNYTILCEIKGLSENETEREVKDFLITFKKDKTKNFVYYPNTINTIRNKIDDANDQFKPFSSINFPTFLLLINDRISDPIDKETMDKALFGEDTLCVDKETKEDLDLVKRNAALLHDKNNLVSSVGYCNLKNNVIKEIKNIKNPFAIVQFPEDIINFEVLMLDENYKFTCVERFLRYVKYDTQSDENSKSFPSTEKQKILSADLAKELKEIGLEDAHLDEWGYVMATLPSNTNKNVSPIAFIAHVDTSPSVTGKNVNPVINRNYQGGDIKLATGGWIIKESENPDLKNMKGFDIITTDGTTLLGADNKAGVAEIIDAANYLITHPEVKHGIVKVCFTPDEEVGRGTEKINLEKLGAVYAYTVDGSSRGEIESETFSADAVVIKFFGKNIHPGYAKGQMINSIKIASAFINSLPKDKLSPETTEGREGYMHPLAFNGNEEMTQVKFIIRNFKTPKLKEYEIFLKDLAEKTAAKFPGARIEFDVDEQYRNMKEVLVNHPKVIDYAAEAMKRLGIKPIMHPIRGGTDGSRLSFMGLPTPNIFAGEHSFHSQLEWVAVQDMEMAVKTIVEICKVWEEKS